MNRRGQTIPIIVLLLILLLLSGMVIVRSGQSDATQTGRVTNRARLEEAARSGLDEVMVKIRRIFEQDNPDLTGGGRVNWRDELLKAVERQMNFTGDSTHPDAWKKFEKVFEPIGLAATEGAVREVGGRITMARVRFHGMRPVVLPADEHFRTKAGYYKENLFADADKDLKPRDFQGYVEVTVTVEIPSAFGALTRTLQVTRDFKIADVTPPAREFALFSFGPPPDPNYINRDLNRGGELSVFPKGEARVLVRGPLFLKVEDLATPTAFGGESRTNPSVSVPETGQGSLWTGWSFIPGPRAIRWPTFAMGFGDIFGILGKVLGGQGASALAKDPIRPHKESGFVTLIGFCPDLRFFANAWTRTALAGNAGIYQAVPPSETIGLALNWAYLTGSIPRKEQTFSLCGMASDRAGGGADRMSFYRGLVFNEEIAPLGVSDGKLELPQTTHALLSNTGTGATGVDDADTIMPEPFYYEAAGGAAGDAVQAGEDHGIYGVYKIATYDRYVIIPIDLRPGLQLIVIKLRALGTLAAAVPVVGWLGAGAAHILATAIQAVLTTANFMRMAIMATPLYYKISQPADLTQKDVSDLADEDWEDYFFAPYGAYYERVKRQSIWGEVLGDVALVATAYVLNRAIGWALKKIFTPLGGRVDAKAIAGNKDVRFSKKVAALMTGRGASGKFHSAMRWVLRRFPDTIRYASGGGAKHVQWVAAHAMIQRTVHATAVGAGFAGMMGLFNKVRRGVQVSSFSGRNFAGSSIALGQDTRISDLTRAFPKGFYAPKYRPYFRLTTRTYETFADFQKARTDPANGQLRVEDVVQIKTLEVDQPGQTISYRGRGVLVVTGDTGTKAPRLNVNLKPADARSWLTIVYENLNVDPAVPPAMLELGEEVQASVYSTQGVRPAGQRTQILGNLVTYNLNKSKIDRDKSVHVLYETDRLPPAKDTGGRRDWWIVSVSKRIASPNVADQQQTR